MKERRRNDPSWWDETKTLAVAVYHGVRDARITGLAAEIAYFALLSIPPLLLVLAGIASFADALFGQDFSNDLQQQLLMALGTFLSEDTMSQTIQPLVRDLFGAGRVDLLSIGAITAVWSASRISRILIRTLNISYGVEKPRHPVRRALVALAITLVGVIVIAIILPLIAIGPRLGAIVGNDAFATVWAIVYWPLAAMLVIALLTTFYQVAPKRRAPWLHELPGAAFATVVWIVASFGLRFYVANFFGTGTFGPLAAPFILMLWLYVTGIAVLLGAEANAALTRLRREQQPAGGEAHALRLDR